MPKIWIVASLEQCSPIYSRCSNLSVVGRARVYDDLDASGYISVLETIKQDIGD